MKTGILFDLDGTLLGGVAAAQLVHIQVGGDDHGLDVHDSVVE